MRTLFIIIALVTVSGCDTLGEVLREKKYTLQIHETPNSKQEFGYNDDYDYVGFMVSGKFGTTIYKHQHSANCPHEIAVAPSAGN
jgi:hypothetical protein